MKNARSGLSVRLEDLFRSPLITKQGKVLAFYEFASSYYASQGGWVFLPDEGVALICGITTSKGKPNEPELRKLRAALIDRGLLEGERIDADRSKKKYRPVSIDEKEKVVPRMGASAIAYMNKWFGANMRWVSSYDATAEAVEDTKAELEQADRLPLVGADPEGGPYLRAAWSVLEQWPILRDLTLPKTREFWATFYPKAVAACPALAGVPRDWRPMVGLVALGQMLKARPEASLAKVRDPRPWLCGRLKDAVASHHVPDVDVLRLELQDSGDTLWSLRQVQVDTLDGLTTPDPDRAGFDALLDDVLDAEVHVEDDNEPAQVEGDDLFDDDDDEAVEGHDIDPEDELDAIVAARQAEDHGVHMGPYRALQGRRDAPVDPDPADAVRRPLSGDVIFAGREPWRLEWCADIERREDGGGWYRLYRRQDGDWVDLGRKAEFDPASRIRHLSPHREVEATIRYVHEGTLSADGAAYDLEQLGCRLVEAKPEATDSDPWYGYANVDDLLDGLGV
ncbi:MAG: hypothetical protein H6733_10120 [Alphaproteobacteria bacterium]|nr:hypothetical protein [Alphaproteobacteria bacterium]